jgi:hypothetical protein
MEYVKIGPAEIALPTWAQWNEAIGSGELDGSPLVSARVASSWLANHGHITEAVLGAQRIRDKWWGIPLLHIVDVYLPVHFENVICRLCNKRGGLSACPEITGLWWPGRKGKDVWSLFDGFPVLNCPHCKSPLTHRHTIWFAPNVGAERTTRPD